jgi:hypothetical protein
MTFLCSRGRLRGHDLEQTAELQEFYGKNCARHRSHQKREAYEGAVLDPFLLHEGMEVNASCFHSWERV